MKKIMLILILLIPALAHPQDLSRLELDDVFGNKYVLKDHLKHDATIVLFWATWCLPCKEEFNALHRLQEKYSADRIQVITISQDTPRSLAKVKSFVKTHPYKFTYLLDLKGDVSKKLLIHSVPQTMLLDSSGKVIFMQRGYRKGDEDQLEKEMNKYWELSKLKEKTE